MTAAAFVLLALGIWILDSAVHGRAPIKTLDTIITTGTLTDVPGAVAAAPGGGYSSAPVVASGSVASWIAQATQIMVAHGIPASEIDPQALAIIIKNESGGNPAAINNYDINAQEGHPSEGLMQTIGPTFQRWHLPGYDSIYDPVDNIIAGTRYAIARYGSLDNVPGVLSVRAGEGYRPY